MSKRPAFGINGFPRKFFDSPFATSKVGIFNWLSSLGLDVLELPYEEMRKMSKKMRMDFLAAKEESGIILSAEMFSNIDFTKMEETKKRYEEFLELAIELDISHILVPLYKVPKTTNISKVISFFEWIRESTPQEINIYPEISGNTRSLGSLDDIIYICSNVKGVYPCLDFGCLHGREFGSLTSAKKIEQVFTIIEKFLGRNILNHCYCKVYPVSYNQKGITERKLFGEQFYGQLNLFNQSLEYLPKASEYITAILKKDIHPITVSRTDHMEEVGAMQLRDIYFYKTVQ